MKKISKNFVMLGLASIALVTPVVAVVSCGGSNGGDLGDLQVLSPALGKLQSATDETINNLLISPSSNQNGVNTITMPKLEDSEKGTFSEVTNLSKTFTLYTTDELESLETPLPAGSRNLITEDELAQALTEYNIQINAELNKLLQEEIATGTDINHTLTLMTFENTFRYSYEFNYEARTLTFKVFEFIEHETDLTRFADKFMADPVVGIKPLTKTQMGNLYAGESYEFFNGGGVLGYEWMNKQYHLNGNYLVAGAKPTSPSTSDSANYKSDFDAFLTNFNGENVETTIMKNGQRVIDRDYQRFGIDANAPKDIVITTKSKPDLMNQKLYIEFTFHKNGTLDTTSSPYRYWITDVPGQTETVVRLIELPDAIPNGVSTPNFVADKAKFAKAINQITSLLGIDQVASLIDSFLLGNQPELKPFKDAISETVSYIKYGFDHHQGTGLLNRDTKTEFTDLNNQISAEFLEDLYNEICRDPRISMDYLIKVGDIVASWLPPHSTIAQIPSHLAEMTTSEQATLLSMGYALYFEHDFILNWKPDSDANWTSGWTKPTPAANPAP